MRRTTLAELPDVLAVGGWLKSAACRLARGVAQMSPVHGDLGDPLACAALDASVTALLDAGPGPLAGIAHDLHPDFYSTRVAWELAERLGVPALGVQHHHAHIAAVMAEHDLSAAVIGLALDGVGLGSDGQAWGGELLWVRADAFERLGHLGHLRLPGGDVAAREPWRLAASVLSALGRDAQIVQRYAGAVAPTLAAGVQRMLERDLNCPATSSAGRWFDAAAAALGLSVRQQHEAQAAMALQERAERWFALEREPSGLLDVVADPRGVLDLHPLVGSLFDTPAADVDEAAARFHAVLATALAEWAGAAARQADIDTVCLGGGCFVNRVLTQRVTRELQARGLRVLRPQRHSCGDAGLALGQAWVAAHRLRAAGAASAHSNESLSCA